MRATLLALTFALLVPALFAGCGRDLGTAPEGSRSLVTGAATGGALPRAVSQATGERFLIEVNREIARRGMGIAVARAEMLVKPGFEALGRTLFASDRFKRLGERWVPGDERRQAEGDALTFLSVRAQGSAQPDLTPDETGAAVTRCFATWESASACAPIDFIERPDTGADATIVDYFLSVGDLGDPYLADIVNAGFWPGELFDRLAQDGSQFILAVTFTLVFVDDRGYPTDLDRNREYDTALAEIYYNNEFPWSVTGEGGIDVETVALHENGHALGLGHFGDIFRTEANGRIHIAPRAVMNAAYTGPLRIPQRTDKAAFCGEYASWR